MELLIAIAIVALIVGSSFIVFKGDKPSTSKELPFLPIEEGSVYLNGLKSIITIQSVTKNKVYPIKAIHKNGSTGSYTSYGRIIRESSNSKHNLVKRIK